ncbi:MAG: 8-amino-7-oxononanoate synthase [Acidobacteriota bacterium]|nr:8-amino-7-oxononanoate synthase [Acidobacteriota bacterium]
MKASGNSGDQAIPASPNASPGAEVPEPWLDRFARLFRHRQRSGRQRQITPASGLDFCSNDYLGLRQDPRLAQAAARAAREFGSGSGAARLLRGTTPLHEALERALAAWKACESALLFNTGYQANATIIPALAGPGDAVFSDALNHASLVDGCRMAKANGAQVIVYPHLDLQELDVRLKSWRASSRGLALVASDGVFSMDGDAADLPALLELCGRHEALLLVDEAHATGLLGPSGAGLAELQGVLGQVPLVMGTFGKALGSFGAFLGGPSIIVDHLLNTARGFIFSTALPPSVAGATLKAVELAQAERWRGARALGFAGRVRGALGLPRQDSAIVSLVAGDELRALALSSRMQGRGFDVRAIRPPTVPLGTSRLRITTGAHLEEGQVDAMIQTLRELL